MNTSLYAGIPIIHGHFQDIHKIVDVKLKGKNGNKLFLGYMTESYYIEAGLYIKDEGYILGVEGSEGSFYPMPTGNDLKYYQENGFYQIHYLNIIFRLKIILLDIRCG
jgi:hypothetical protein